ncbi:MAG: preprotein translocase subunit YajC [Planctomycetes bacterium]|nr:preprotein translocase subunit YajC [Planctomycetota bacterium]
MNNISILAQADAITSEPVGEEGQISTFVVADPNGGAAAARRESPLGGYGQFVFIGLMIVVFYFLMFRGPKKKQQQHQKMVKGLKKNDRVRTIGGIIATVVDVKDDEITLKIDESNNTKIKVTPSAIGSNVSQEK